MGHSVRSLALSEKDQIAKLKELGVLRDINSKKLDLEKGIIAFICGDCDQSEDEIGYVGEMQKEQRDTKRTHVIALNGGAIRLSSNLPDDIPDAAEIILHDIKKTRERTMKGIDTVGLHVHWPCGIADSYKISIRDQIEYLIEAKNRVKELNDGIRVICLFHIDFGPDTNPEHPSRYKRTYTVSRKIWEEKRDEFNEFLANLNQP